MMLDRTVVVACLLVFAACSSMPGQRPASAPAAEPAPEAKPAAPAPPPSAAGGSTNPVEAVPLEVKVTGQTTTGRVMKLRAKVVNPHPDEVKGVRVQLVFVAPSAEGEPMKVLEIQQKEMVTTLEPGGADMIRWDVESMYLGPDAGGFFLAAYPKMLGGKEMPPPDNWNE